MAARKMKVTAWTSYLDDRLSTSDKLRVRAGRGAGLPGISSWERQHQRPEGRDFG
jgi:hypothetical protein